MAIRRIVTGIDPEGRSFVADGSATDIPGFAEIWPGGPELRLEPAPGGSSWRGFDLPPDEVVAAWTVRSPSSSIAAQSYSAAETASSSAVPATPGATAAGGR